jgi:hypothetical protein
MVTLTGAYFATRRLVNSQHDPDGCVHRDASPVVTGHELPAIVGPKYTIRDTDVRQFPIGNTDHAFVDPAECCKLK